MPRTKISEFSSTPGSNTDIDGINIAEGCAPSGINDAIRELMSQLKDFQAGTAGDSFNGPVGTSTAAAGAFTTLSASGTVSGTGFSNYLASPPAIGGTAAAAGSFTTLSASGAFLLSGDQVQVSEGGTGASTASAARTNLGLAIGTDVQAYSATTASYASNGIGFRNRIINGDMRIDQRNAGASVTPPTATQTYTLDRWAVQQQLSAFTIQQNSGGVTPPAGFTNYLGVTVTTSRTVTSGSYYTLNQYIEGFNTADLNWGTANAQPITISFWVRSSLTGTFSVAVNNAAANRAYPTTYTINSANTWEFKTVTIPGDTTGTWQTGNFAGIRLWFGLGWGSSYTATPGSWTGTSEVYASTGVVNLVQTNGATFYITGVQLEAGSVATPFERRPYGTELALCQRYFEKSWDIATAVGTATGVGLIDAHGIQGLATTTGYLVGSTRYVVPKRANPTLVLYDAAGNANKVRSNVVGSSSVDNQPAIAGSTSSSIGHTALRDTGGTAANGVSWHFSASAEL